MLIESNLRVLFLNIVLLFQWALQAQGLWVEKKSKDYGKINFWNNEAFTVKVINQSSKELNFLPIFYNQNYKVWFSHPKLKPGEEGQISIVYYSDKKGKFEKTIPVYHSLSGEPVNFTIKGYIKDFDPEALMVCPTVNNGPSRNVSKIKIEVRDFDTDKVVEADRLSVESLSGRKIKLYADGKGYEALISTGQYQIGAHHADYEPYDARVGLASHQKKFIVYLVKKPVETYEPEEIFVPEEVFEPEVVEEEKPKDELIFPDTIYDEFEVTFEPPKEDRPDVVVTTEPDLIDTTMVENDHSNQKELDLRVYKFNNIILVADISTSMKYNNKMDYLNSSVNQLIEALRTKDQVGMISLASTANIIHAPGFVTNKDSLRSILSTIKIGGATNGGAALQLAYKMASEHYVEDGNNQIIIATDGTFTGGSMSRRQMHTLIALKAKEGIHLSTIGLNPNERGIMFLKELANLGLGDYIQINGKENEETKLLEMVKLQSKKTP